MQEAKARGTQSRPGIDPEGANRNVAAFYFLMLEGSLTYARHHSMHIS